MFGLLKYAFVFCSSTKVVKKSAVSGMLDGTILPARAQNGTAATTHRAIVRDRRTSWILVFIVVSLCTSCADGSRSLRTPVPSCQRRCVLPHPGQTSLN